MIKKYLAKIRNGIAYIKFYVQRSSSYLAVINASMILFLLLSNLSEKGIIQANLDKYYVALLILGLLALISFGALDIHLLRANQVEQVLNFKYNPAMVEIGTKISEINTKMNGINTKLDNLERRLESLKKKDD